MSRFISDKKRRIEISNGDWVEIRESLPYAVFARIFSGVDSKNPMNNLALALPLLQEAVVAWSFLDDSGNPVPCNIDTIGNLDTPTIMEVLEPVFEIYMPEKKSLMASEASSSQDASPEQK